MVSGPTMQLSCVGGIFRIDELTFFHEHHVHIKLEQVSDLLDLNSTYNFYADTQVSQLHVL